MERIGFWMKEIRAPFLSLSVALVFLGTSVGFADGSLDPRRAFLAVLGLVLLHIAVNVFNECSDLRTGIDLHTHPTPFSGGSGMLTSGAIAPSHAAALGALCLIAGVIIGLYFIYATNIKLLPLLLLGGVAVCAYTDILARRFLGEVFAGLGLGLLPVLGSAFVQTGHYSWASFAAGVPAGILTFNLLLLNEFPDLEADSAGGRKNILIAVGKRRAGRIYAATMLAMYLWIIGTAVIGLTPLYCLPAIFTFAIAIKPMRWALDEGRDMGSSTPALAGNVAANLGTLVLLGIGFILSAVL